MVVAFGDSTCQGVGEAGATTTLDDDLNLYEDSTTAEAGSWQDTATLRPGFLRAFTESMRAASPATTITAIRAGVNGSESGSHLNNQIPRLHTLCAQVGVDPEVIIYSGGTNNADDPADASAFETELPAIVSKLRQWRPDAWILIPKIDPPGASYTEKATINAAIDAAASANTNVLAVEITGATYDDGAHFDIAGNGVVAAALWTALQSA